MAADEPRPGPTQCTAIVPFRPDATGTRTANLAAVLRWLETMAMDVVVVQHGGTSPSSDPTDRLRFLHIESDGPFSKAVACNAGFGAASTSVVAVVDADTMVERRQFLGCVARVRDDVDVIRPFGHLVELDRTATRAVHDGTAPSEVAQRDDPPTDQGPVTSRSDRHGEIVPICGGVVIMKAAAYERAGGMDESFVGWGGEDDALSAALVRTGSDCRIFRTANAYHLWHPREPLQRYVHPHYPTNVERARWWHQATDAEVAHAVAAGRRRLRSRSAEVDAIRDR